MNKLWASYEHEQLIKCNEKVMNKSWTRHEPVMNKSCTSIKQVINKSWTSCEQVMNI